MVAVGVENPPDHERGYGRRHSVYRLAPSARRVCRARVSGIPMARDSRVKMATPETITVVAATIGTSEVHFRSA